MNTLAQSEAGDQRNLNPKDKGSNKIDESNECNATESLNEPSKILSNSLHVIDSFLIPMLATWWRFDYH